MTDAIYLIVEGDGEEVAAPELIRRLLYEKHQEFAINVKTLNAKGNANLMTRLEDFLEVTRRKSDCVGVLVLLDLETTEVCAMDLAKGLAKRAKELNLQFPVVVVCAVCEYESWFLGSLETIAPKWLQPDSQFEGNLEQKCNAKEWLSERMIGGRIYKETLDQVRMTTEIDIGVVAEKSRSFKRLIHAVEQLLELGNTVTPL